MATLNEMIAQGAQFYTPDPTAQYNKMAQMQKYQQENELAKMQMEEYGRARQESNALRQFLPGLNESNRSQLLGYGAAGQGVYKTLAEGDTQQRLRDQARSQADLNESSILKNAVAQTRDAVAGIDPNDVESYAALRTSVLTQYPKLEPYMPAAWDANVKQRLITTAASVLEGQKPRPPVILRPGDMAIPANDPRLTGTGVTVPAAAAAAVKPPDKIEIMTLLGYPLTPEGDAAYEAAKRAAPTVSAPTGTLAEMKATGIPETPEGLALYYRLKEKPPVVAPQALTTEERNARAIALGAGPEGSPEFNAALREEISRMTAKPPAAAKAEPTTNEMTNARAIALGAGPEGSLAYNQSLQTQLLRLTTKAEPIIAPPAPSEQMKNADAFARLKGEPGTPAYNREFAAQMARLTAKSGGGEGGGGAGGSAGTGTVEVVDPKDRTKTIIVTKARAVAEGLTPAKAMEGLPIKEKQRRESVYPKVKQAMTTVTNTMSTIEETIDRLLANTSGLNGVTGLIYGITPALTDAARQADADLGQLANLAFVQGLTELRSASSTGAGVGNVSNKEGDRFENLKSSLKRTQSFGDMKASLIRLKAQAQATKNIVNTEFEDMYEYRQGQAPAAPGKPAPAAAGVAPPPGFKRD